MAKNKPSIQFHFNYSFSLKQRLLLKERILWLFKEEGVQLDSLSFVFCSDEELYQLNYRFLHHHTYTDILTFHLSEPTLPIIGEIYISIERIHDNSHQLQLPFHHELTRVIFHGCLHLCGYKDKSKHQKREMTAKEDFYLFHSDTRST